MKLVEEIFEKATVRVLSSKYGLSFSRNSLIYICVIQQIKHCLFRHIKTGLL